MVLCIFEFLTIHCLAPLAVIILGRDIGLIFASFIVRFISLPQPVSCDQFSKIFGC